MACDSKSKLEVQCSDKADKLVYCCIVCLYFTTWLKCFKAAWNELNISTDKYNNYMSCITKKKKERKQSCADLWL